MKFSLYKLNRNNTTPFVFVSIIFTLFLLIPFFYYSYLKSQPHTSYDQYGSIEQSKNDDNIDSIKVSESNLRTNEYDEEEEEKPSDGTGESVQVFVTNPKNWKENAESRQFKMLTRFATFSFILGLGALGAAVSLITRTRNKEIVENEISILEILSIQTIGAIFAMILGFAFLGNMISGTLFPNPKVFYRILYIPSAFGKLAVWSFIAGFSERLVPNILNNLTKKSDITKDNEED